MRASGTRYCVFSGLALRPRPGVEHFRPFFSRLRPQLRKSMEVLGCQPWDVGVVLTTDEEVRELNAQVTPIALDWPSGRQGRGSLYDPLDQDSSPHARRGSPVAGMRR